MGEPLEHDAVQNKHQAERQLRKDLWISALAVVSVAIGLYDIARPRTTTEWRWYDVLDLAIVVVFIIDFIVSAARSGDWKTYTRKHWYELPALIPITGNLAVGSEAIPLLRGLRLVRLVRVLRLMRIIGTVGRMRKFWSTALRIARRAHIARLCIFGLTMVGLGAALAWLFEAPVNERMAQPANAIWWSLNMFTNVAYVDFQPLTGPGRVVAAVLEISGIGFIGLFTASLAGAIVLDKDRDEPAKPEPPLD
jgi:voltage-gated potassium channel